MLYMALAPEAKLTYALGGPAAEARFEAGVAGFEARSFRGCGIMTSEPFEVSDGAPREDGEFVRGGRTHAPRFARRRPGLRADADAQQPGGRVLRHAAAAGRSWHRQGAAHLGHAHLRRGVGPPRAHHLGRGLGRVLRVGAHWYDQDGQPYSFRRQSRCVALRGSQVAVVQRAEEVQFQDGIRHGVRSLCRGKCRRWR